MSFAVPSDPPPPLSSEAGNLVAETWADVYEDKRARMEHHNSEDEMDDPDYVVKHKMTFRMAFTTVVRNRVLYPLGIDVEDEPGLEVGTLARAHFDTSHDPNLAQRYPASSVWVTVQKVREFMFVYGELISHDDIRQAELTEAIQRCLLRNSYDGSSTGRGLFGQGLYIQRWKDTRMHSMRLDTHWVLPPHLRGLYSSFFGRCVAIGLRPAISYRLTLEDTEDPVMRKIDKELCRGKGFHPYLAVHWYNEKEQASEIDLMALVGGWTLYNRFRLRRAALASGSENARALSAADDSSATIKNFGITFGPANDFTIWLIEPYPSSPELDWNGCRVQKMLSGCLHRLVDVTVLAQWINEIHR